jgi:Domain of unknown function (DUF4276)
LVSAIIFLEGGGDSKDLHVRCRAGFRKLLEQCGLKNGSMPRLSACGGRAAVFDDFCTEHSSNSKAEFVAMWIDSEEPMADVEESWQHLANVNMVAKWTKPEGASDDQVLFMTTCMETYIVADRATLKKYYGSKLQQSALPPQQNLEQRSRQQVQEKLVEATRNCSNAYAKGKRSFDILGKLTPAALQKHLPSFFRVCRILEKKLQAKQRQNENPRRHSR